MKKNVVIALAALLVSSCVVRYNSNEKVRPLPAANKEIGVKY